MSARLPLLVLILAEAGVGWSCAHLPDNYKQLSLEEQVAAYNHYIRNRFPYGYPEGREYISLHGHRAADLMATMFNEGTGLPAAEAIDIIHDVQTRGCDLRGSRAEKAIKDYLKNGKTTPAEIVAARAALESIRNNLSSPGGGDLLGRGECASVDGRSDTQEDRQ